MAKKKSPITGNEATPAFKKSGVQYYTDELNNLFCKALDQSNMVGGTDEAARSEQNATRIERIKELTGISNPVVLDYGCGTGILTKALNEAGAIGIGFDKFTDCEPLPTDERCHAATLIEVVEHLTAPFAELDEVFKALAKGGKVMIETSFSDWLTEADSYINPEIGHCTIFSHAGLDHLMTLKGFTPDKPINRNVRVYRK
jgi:2-polyprenyl-3-methyl-5-hydroxy-6-metoxy-1,4-benzoquinol methylase